MNTKLYLYKCHNCTKYCSQIRESTDIDDTDLCGYDEINDCEYCFKLEKEYISTGGMI